MKRENVTEGKLHSDFSHKVSSSSNVDDGWRDVCDIVFNATILLRFGILIVQP